MQMQVAISDHSNSSTNTIYLAFEFIPLFVVPLC